MPSAAMKQIGSMQMGPVAMFVVERAVWTEIGLRKVSEQSMQARVLCFLHRIDREMLLDFVVIVF